MSEDDNTVWYHGIEYTLGIDYRLAAGLMTTGTLTESEVLDFLIELK